MATHSYTYSEESHIVDNSSFSWIISELLSLIDSSISNISIFISDPFSIIDFVTSSYFWIELSIIVDSTKSAVVSFIEEVLSLIDTFILGITKEDSVSIDDNISYDLIEAEYPDGEEAIEKRSTFIWNKVFSLFSISKSVFIERSYIPISPLMPKESITSKIHREAEKEVLIPRVWWERRAEEKPSITYMKIPETKRESDIYNPLGGGVSRRVSSLRDIKMRFSTSNFVDKVKSSRKILGKRYV